MAFVTSTIALAGLALSAIGTAVQFSSAQKARKQSESQFNRSNELRREAEAKDKELRDLQVMRTKRAAAREAQQRRADIVSSSTAGGVAESSGRSGAISSLGTQLSSNISFLDQASGLQTQASSLFGEAKAVGSAPVFTSTIGSSIAGLGSSLFSNNEKIADLFA